jgi:hypothetical protein
VVRSNLALITSSFLQEAPSDLGFLSTTDPTEVINAFMGACFYAARIQGQKKRFDLLDF